MNPRKFFVVRAVVVLIILAAVGVYFLLQQKEKTPIEVPDTVVDVGNSVEKSNLVRLTSPLPNAKVSSPLTLRGEARGNWYFEASFPVFVVDWDGKIIGQGIATADGDWMTTEFVPFTASITFDTAQIQGQYSNRGTLILKKDNPSGLPQYDDALEIPVMLQ